MKKLIMIPVLVFVFNMPVLAMTLSSGTLTVLECMNLCYQDCNDSWEIGDTKNIICRYGCDRGCAIGLER